jgi:hypothetical protein
MWTSFRCAAERADLPNALLLESFHCPNGRDPSVLEACWWRHTRKETWRWGSVGASRRVQGLPSAEIRDDPVSLFSRPRSGDLHEGHLGRERQPTPIAGKRNAVIHRCFVKKGRAAEGWSDTSAALWGWA